MSKTAAALRRGNPGNKQHCAIHGRQNKTI